MRILGIDPGIGRTGWGIIDKGRDVVPVAYDCFETKENSDTAERLALIYDFFMELVAAYKPDALAIEDLFFNTNAKTALVVGQARGVILLIAAQHNMPIGVYTPPQVKIAVTGYGKAEKAQVGQMIKTILKLPAIPKPDDTADALAIALTHAYSLKINA